MSELNLKWDYNIVYDTLQELEEVNRKIGLTNNLWTLQEILQEYLAQLENE